MCQAEYIPTKDAEGVVPITIPSEVIEPQGATPVPVPVQGRGTTEDDESKELLLQQDERYVVACVRSVVFSGTLLRFNDTLSVNQHSTFVCKLRNKYIHYLLNINGVNLSFPMSTILGL